MYSKKISWQTFLLFNVNSVGCKHPVPVPVCMQTWAHVHVSHVIPPWASPSSCFLFLAFLSLSSLSSSRWSWIVPLGTCFRARKAKGSVWLMSRACLLLPQWGQTHWRAPEKVLDPVSFCTCSQPLPWCRPYPSSPIAFGYVTLSRLLALCCTHLYLKNDINPK
jgi:hypothetical protein